ncbi:hypothetical protein DFO55_101688 [Grimontella sp. AG753]|nr:hypothetical protein DFO55_101688 [Grimontella sp. AG753]
MLAASKDFIYSRPQAWSVTMIFTISLFLFWNIEIFKYGNNFLGSDSFIIVDRILNSDHLKWFEQTYLSQFGIQGIILSLMHSGLFSFSVIDVSLQSSLVISLMTALVFSVPSYKILKFGGIYSVMLYWLSLALSPWVLPFSYSLYWVPFTLMLPFSIAFITGKMMFNGKRPLMLSLIVIAMTIKCLCGYEYITTVTLFACAGYVFSLIGTKHNARISDLILIFSACVTGFILAVIAHSLQLNSIDSEYGFSTILNRVELHTGTDGGADYAQILISHLSARPGNEDTIKLLSSAVEDHKLLFIWLSFKEYFYLPALVVFDRTVSFGWFVFIALLVSLSSLTLFIKKYRDYFNKDFYLYSIGCALVMSGVFSWQILAWHHMTIHFHLNGQLFAYGIVPASMVSIGVLIHRTIGKNTGLSELSTKTPTFIVALCCVYLSLISTFSYKGNIYDNFQSYGKSGAQVIGNVDQVVITPTSSELYRGMGMTTSRIFISGWAISKGKTPAKLYVLINGGLVGEISPDIERNDVKKVYPEANVKSGFIFAYDVPGSIDKDNIKILAPNGNGGYSEIKF